MTNGNSNTGFADVTDVYQELKKELEE